VFSRLIPLTLALLCFVFLQPCGASPIITDRAPIKGLSLPLFGKDKTKPAAKMTLGVVTIGAKKAGLFRVGILPVLVGRKVTIEFASDQMDPEALRDVAAALQSLTETDSAEFYDLCIFTPSSRVPQIYARKARVDGDEDWELRDAVAGDGSKFSKATLRLHGGPVRLLRSQSSDH
jgi:hypothetical protein